MPPVPRDVRKALDLLAADLAGTRRVDEVARACGVAPRTLQKHLRAFAGTTPGRARRAARLDQARLELLRAGAGETVTAVATRCGFQHLGRFAMAYRERFGEAPSVTLGRCRLAPREAPRSRLVIAVGLDRPVVAVLPFATGPGRELAGMAAADDITTVLVQSRWIATGRPTAARYHLAGRIAQDASGSCTTMLLDAVARRYVWAARWNAAVDPEAGLDEQVAARIGREVEEAVRTAEIARASLLAGEPQGAWDLTMQALPRALTLDAASQERALDLLERAMEAAPHDALPVAFAAWCHGQRGTHHFTQQAPAEKRRSRELVRRAVALRNADARAEALLATAETLAHDLEAGARHCERSLALDSTCTWGWIRRGFVHAYRAEAADALECFRIARALGPDDPLAFSCSIGIGVAHFEVGAYGEAAQWWTRLVREHPQAVWAHRFIAPALLRQGREDEARHSFALLRAAYPELRLGDVRYALPHTEDYMDRACEALEGMGMRP